MHSFVGNIIDPIGIYISLQYCTRSAFKSLLWFNSQTSFSQHIFVGLGVDTQEEESTSEVTGFCSAAQITYICNGCKKNTNVEKKGERPLVRWKSQLGMRPSSYKLGLLGL